MTRLLVLFLAGFIGLLLRFVYVGEFELNQLLLLILFPIGAIVIALITRKQYINDQEYRPPAEMLTRSTRLADRVSDQPKPIFSNQHKIATYQRVYEKWWQRYVADGMGRPGNWYLKLHISFEDGPTLTIQELQKKQANRTWGIYQNEKQIGSIAVDQSLKTVKDQQRKLFVQYENRHYEWQSALIGSRASLFDAHQEIAIGDRKERSIRALRFTAQLDSEEEQLLTTTYLFFNYIFGK